MSSGALIVLTPRVARTVPHASLAVRMAVAKPLALRMAGAKPLALRMAPYSMLNATCEMSIVKEVVAVSPLPPALALPRPAPPSALAEFLIAPARARPDCCRFARRAEF